MSRVAILASTAVIALAPALLPAQTTSPYPGAYSPIPSSSGIGMATPVQRNYPQTNMTTGAYPTYTGVPVQGAYPQNDLGAYPAGNNAYPAYPQTTLGAYPMGRAPVYGADTAVGQIEGAYPDTDLAAVPYREGVTSQKTYVKVTKARPQAFLVVNPACVSVVQMSTKGSAARVAYPAAVTTTATTPPVETATTGVATTVAEETIIGTTNETTSTSEAVRPVKIIRPKTATTVATTPQTTVEAATTATTTPATTEAVVPVTTYVPTPATTETTTTTETTEHRGSANRMMPETGIDWLALVLGGSALSGLGILLRRRRSHV